MKMIERRRNLLERYSTV